MRTTEAQVAGIIELDANVSVTPFIETAAELVTEHCTDSNYSSTKLELIERYLSAHFYAVRVGVVRSEKAGDVSQDVFGKVDLYLAQTKYGQQAILLDSKGNLAALNKRMAKGRKGSASITSLGANYSNDRPRF